MPEQGASRVNCVKRPKLCRHGLSGAIQHGRVNLDEFEGSDHCQHRLSARRQFEVSFLSADKKKTYCLYEAPDPDAIREAARKAGLPADGVELGDQKLNPGRIDEPNAPGMTFS